MWTYIFYQGYEYFCSWVTFSFLSLYLFFLSWCDIFLSQSFSLFFLSWCDTFIHESNILKRTEFWNKPCQKANSIRRDLFQKTFCSCHVSRMTQFVFSELTASFSTTFQRHNKVEGKIVIWLVKIREQHLRGYEKDHLATVGKKLRSWLK